MMYNSQHYYRIGYVTMIVVLIPWLVMMAQMDKSSSLSIVLISVIIGSEYSYIFPRQAMKIYEEILLSSFLERINGNIAILILILITVSQVYWLVTNNIIPLIIIVLIDIAWSLIFRDQSIIIGDKNIIIGNKLIPYNSVESVSLEEKSVEIETDEESFKIYNWAIKKQRYKLERLLKQRTDKLENS